VQKPQPIDNPEAQAMRSQLQELVYTIDQTTDTKTIPLYRSRTKPVDLVQEVAKCSVDLEQLLIGVSNAFELAKQEKMKRTGEFNNPEFAKKIIELYTL
jgi:hypothetical protein